MKIINKKTIGLATLFFALFVGLTALADESAWFELNPSLESGFTGTANNCNPLTVSNGSVAAYPDCTITCDDDYDLDGSTCERHHHSSGGGGGRSSKAKTTVATATVTPTVAVSTTTTTTIYKFTKFLNNKSLVADIKNLQLALNKALGTALIQPLVIDGKWGPKTTAAVIAFQKANGLVGDGKFGPLSFAKMNLLLSL